MIQKENPVIVGLDIGTTKIVAIAGRKNEYGKLEILGFGKSDSSGVNHGMVLNIEECIRSIQLALENLMASNPGLLVKEVYVGIAGHHIKSIQTRGDRVLNNPEEVIRKEDIEALIHDQYKTFLPAGDQIIDIIPQEFTVDGISDLMLKDVVGMSGIKIGANFHIITGDKTAIRNIHRCVGRSGLNTRDLVLQPLASAAAVMCEEDLEAGVAIVDIGGGTTDLAIFHEGKLKHTVVIPIAGVNITNDIRIGLGVLRSQAEQMKVQFGMALANEAKPNAFITIPGLKGQQPKEISAKNLANIIQSRMEEILEYVVYHIRQQNLQDKLHGGIILTGGGSQLKHLIQLTQFHTGLDARIGLPNEHLAAGHTTELLKPMYATCIGLILRGYDDFEQNRQRFVSSNSEAITPMQIEPTGVFTAPPGNFEPSVQELLQQEFGASTSGSELVSAGEDALVLEHEKQVVTNLFNQPVQTELSATTIQAEKAGNRKDLISNVFNTVRNKVIYWFENVDDQPLDSK